MVHFIEIDLHALTEKTYCHICDNVALENLVILPHLILHIVLKSDHSMSLALNYFKTFSVFNTD